MLEPTSLTELQDAVRNHPRVLAIGGRTKPRLSQVDDCRLLATGNLTGITEYEPSEYTFTALAGTPIEELKQALLEQGQAMPFDPLLSQAGSTLGGTTAAGLSGPERFRFGGIRDFLLGIRYVDGAGEVIRAGCRVVKNAAGFDLPKLMVGSLGRFGILYELTFKVFPAVPARQTLEVRCTDPQQATKRLIEAACSRWELMALDYQPAQDRILLQLGGPRTAIEQIATEIEQCWPGDVLSLEPEAAVACWETIRGLGLPVKGAGPNGRKEDQTGAGETGLVDMLPATTPVVIQVALTPTMLVDLEQRLAQFDSVQTHYSVGANVATLTSVDSHCVPTISKHLAELQLTGLVLHGSAAPLWLGVTDRGPIDRALQTTLDPQHRFPPCQP